MAIVILAALDLSSCTIPRAGALKREFLRNSSGEHIAVVSIAELPDSANESTDVERFSPTYAGQGEVDFETIRSGDVLTVTIFESATQSGLMTFERGRIEFSELVVDRRGFIAVPFAGQLPVQNLSLDQIADVITERLSNRILNPQVDVRIVRQPRGFVTVVGGKESHLELTRGTARLSSALAVAEIDSTQSGGIQVTLRRGVNEETISLDALLSSSENDVALRDEDVVTFWPKDRYVIALGAVGKPQRIKIPTRHYSLLAAIADIQGLDDELADPSAVFLIRNPRSGEGTLPSIIEMDTRQPMHLAAAERLQVADGDVVFVSNAAFAQVRKVLSPFMSGISGVVRYTQPRP